MSDKRRKANKTASTSLREPSKGLSPLTPEDAPMRFVTVRAMCIACALMPVLALWVVQSELIWYSGHSTAISLFFHVTFALFLIGLANLYVQKKWPARALSPGEMMTIYMMLAIAGTFCSHDLLQVMIPMLAYPNYAANPMNNWDVVLLEHIPEWAILSDNTDAMNGLAVGNASMYRLDLLLAWARPLMFWSVFIGALVGALLCINLFFRKHWTEKEKLSFPIIQIPLIISTGLETLLKSKLFWLAFAVSGTIDIINGIHFLNPNFPQIPIVEAFVFRDYFVERPWNAIAETRVDLYPFVIGLTFFIPTDLAFSCWFFFIFYRVQMVLAAAIGIHDLPGFPFVHEQAAGAYIALGLLAIYLSRRHLIGVARSVVGLPGGASSEGEPLSYRVVFIIFSACCGVLMAQGMLLGASLWVLIIFFTIFFLYSIAIARMRAELGPPAHDLHAMGPDVLMHNALGTRALGTGNVAAFTMFFWFNRAYRAHFSPHSMEGFKAAQLTRILARSMMKAMVVAMIVGLASALWAVLHALYIHGYGGRPAGDAFSSEAWNTMAAWLTFPQRPRMAATSASGIGLLFALFLGALRMRFTWWLWHPVGYATATSWSMERLWFPLFLGWLAKSLITRYGGAKMYRTALPFFVGLVLGEFVIGSLWMIYGAFANMRVYQFWGW